MYVLQIIRSPLSLNKQWFRTGNSLFTYCNGQKEGDRQFSSLSQTDSDTVAVNHFYTGLKNVVRYHSTKFKTWPTPKLPFSYVRPEKPNVIFESGDIDQTIGKIDYSARKIHFELSDELADADENVKRLFSLEMANRQEILAFKRNELLRKVQQHKFDTDSDEVNIAMMTLHIRTLQEHMRIQLYNKQTKHVLNMKIQKRNKLLNNLRRMHIQKFNWLVATLEVNLKRPMLGMVPKVPTRKSELRRMTIEFCLNIKNTRLNTFHEKLKAQQEDFLKKKEEMTKFIEKEENELKLIDTK